MKFFIFFACIYFAFAQVGSLEGNNELVKAIDAAIVRLDINGDIDAAIQQHFGSAAWRINFRDCHGATGADAFYPFPAQPRIGGSLDIVLARQELRLGLELGTDRHPFWYFNPSNGQYYGYYIDLANKIADQLSVRYDKTITIRWVPVHNTLQNTELYKGTTDLIWDLHSEVGVYDEQLKENIWQFPCSTLADQSGAAQGAFQRGTVGLLNLTTINSANVHVAVRRYSNADIFFDLYFPQANKHVYDTYAEQYAAVFSQTANVHIFLSDSAAASEVTAEKMADASKYAFIGGYGPRTALGTPARLDAFSIKKAIPCGSSSCGGVTCQK